MKRKFGVALTILAALMTLVDVIGIFTSTRRCMEMFGGEDQSAVYDGAYKFGYIFGTVATSVIAVVITVILYYYGLRLMKRDQTTM